MAEDTKIGSIHYDLDLDDKDFKKKLSSASDDIKGFKGQLEAAEKGSLMFASGLAAIGAAAIGAIGFGVKFAADIETMTQGFVTLLGSTEEANAAIAMIKKDAAKTPFELPGLINANQLLTSVTKDAQKSERFLLNIGKALTAMGKGQPELDRIIVNLQQIGAIGHANALDLKQFAFAGIPIYDMLNERIKGTGKNLEDMTANGEITFELLTDLFNKAGEGSGRFARAFELQGGTFNQVMSNFKDNIGIALGEIAKQTGVFDAVKLGLAGLTDFIGKNTPLLVQGIKDFVTVITENAPIIIGFLVGGLTPAFIGLAASIWAAMAPLIPFIAAGTALGVVIKLLVDHFGGWDNVVKMISVNLEAFGALFREVVQPAIDRLWLVIQEHLLPQLMRLWEVVGPLLKPALEMLGAVLLSSVVVALRMFVEALIMGVQYVTVWVAAINGGITQVKSLFAGLPDAIRGSMSAVKDAITKPFEAAWLVIQDFVKKTKDALDFTKRHSPSVVDIVKNGVDLVNREFQSLADMTMPNVSDMLGSGINVAQAPATSGFNQNVNIYVDKVNDMQDVRAIGRELGFRAGQNPRMFET